MNNHEPHSRRLALRRALILCWTCALLLAQAAALVHSAVHAAWGDDPHRTGQAAVQEQVRVPSHGGSRALQPAQPNWLLQVVHAGSDNACNLFDAAGHAFVPCGVHVPPRFVHLGTTVLSFLDGEALVRWAALFDARGPPRFG